MVKIVANLFKLNFFLKIILISSFVLQSCTTIAVSSILTSSVLFSRYEKTVIDSKLVRKVQSEINKFLRKNNHRKSIKIVQDGNSIYAIGLTESTNIKQEVVNILNSSIGTNFIDEIAVVKTRQPIIEDSLAEARLKKHLIFTKNLKSQNYQVFVFNGKGYVIGRVANASEKEVLVNALEGVLYLNDIVIYINIT